MTPTTEQTKKLKTDLQQLQSHLATVEQLEDAKRKLVLRAGSSVDLKMGAEFAAINGALDLSKSTAPILRARISETISEGTNLQSVVASELAAIHGKVDEAIAEKVLSTAHEDVRGSINPKLSKPFLAEQSSRAAVSTPYVYVAPGATIDEITRGAETVLASLELLTRESERTTSVARKLGIAA